MTRFVILAALLVAGCDNPITAEQSAEQIKACADHGLTQVSRRSAWDGAITGYQCVPKKAP